MEVYTHSPEDLDGVSGITVRYSGNRHGQLFYEPNYKEVNPELICTSGLSAATGFAGQESTQPDSNIIHA